jgi:hypothetical protein
MLLDGALGVHRFYSGGDVASARATTAYINLYLDRMGVSRAVHDVASLTPANQLTYLSIVDAARLQLIRVTPTRTARRPDRRASR